MSKTPKINRVWNKQEKRIVRLLYRKGFDIDLSNLYGPPIKRQERSTDVKILRLAIWVIVTNGCAFRKGDLESMCKAYLCVSERTLDCLVFKVVK